MTVAPVPFSSTQNLASNTVSSLPVSLSNFDSSAASIKRNYDADPNSYSVDPIKETNTFTLAHFKL